MHYKGTTGNPHDGRSRIGVLLVNNGSPDATDVASIRRYIKMFLSDPRLIELPRLLWMIILHGIILRVRPRRTAKAYRKIWTEHGSPMQVISASLLTKVQQRCTAEWGSAVVVAAGNTCGNPSIAVSLEKLRQSDVHRLVIVPLYPQYTAVTVGSVFDSVAREISSWRWVPEMRFISGYHDQPEYLDAIAGSIKAHWQQFGRSDKLVFSYHSLPQAYVDAGDPYACICSKTSRKLAARLGLAEGSWVMSYQSTFVGGNWLGPDVGDLLKELQDKGDRRVDLICPGFAVDNLETLEEIVEGYLPEFAAKGGEGSELRFISCLNDSDAHAELIASLIRSNLHGWEAFLKPVGAVPSIPDELCDEVADKIA
jgi:ferrochelatase